MSNITASRVENLGKDNQLAISCQYNNEGKYATENPKHIDPYLRVPGLPSLAHPLMVQNAMVARDNTLIGNGQAVIMPPGVSFSFQIGYLCSLGMKFKVTLLPVNKVINTAVYSRNPARATDWMYRSCNQWENNKYIVVDDAQFAYKPDLPPAQANYVKNSYQIRIDVAPMTTITLNDGTTLNEVMDAPGALAAPGSESGANSNELNLNTHHGTVKEGDQGAKPGVTMVKSFAFDESRSVSIVFDVFVMNEKYYSKHNAEIFTNPYLGD